MHIGLGLSLTVLLSLACKPVAPLDPQAVAMAGKEVTDTAPDHLPSLGVKSAVRLPGYGLDAYGLKIIPRGEDGFHINRCSGPNERYADMPTALCTRGSFNPAKRIVVHHTASTWEAPSSGTPEAWQEKCQKIVDGVIQSHLTDQGFSDVGYNFLICPDGTVFEGRVGKWVKPAQAWGANVGSVGISFIGQYSPLPESVKTLGHNRILPPPQIEAAARLIAYLAADSKIDITSMDTGRITNSYPLITFVKGEYKGTRVDGQPLPTQKDLEGMDVRKQRETAVEVYVTAKGLPALTTHKEIFNSFAADFGFGTDIGPIDTECPGKLVYDKIPHLRGRAMNLMRQIYGR